MRIEKNLCLVIPITRADGAEIFVHSTPISTDIFETYFEPISVAFSRLYSRGLGIVGGARIAHMMLKKVAQELGVWDGPGGVERGLVAEIHRLTNVLASGARGWEMIPFDEAIRTGVLESVDASTVDGLITFFTLAFSMHPKAMQRTMIEPPMQLCGARIESSSCTEFINSLPISTAAGNTGVKAVA
jgi:hypothetical protein